MEFLDKIIELINYNPNAPLIFTDGLFLFLFLIFILIHAATKRNLNSRILFIVAFSLFFYYKTSGIYVLLLIFVSLSDFILGKLIADSQAKRRRKLLLATSISINLGLLCYFKYTNFFVGMFSQLTQNNFAFQDIFLPIGISFFTFQSMSYIIDVYRGQLPPVKLYVDYLFFVSFFPQLVAGPIVRAKDFIPQITGKPLVTKEMFGTGVFLIACGLFKKAVISDYISLNFVDRIFDAPLLYTGFENLMAVYGYALQIYCDFSGYSDMAIGIALLLGFRFPANFDSPYKSATITEFWRRWHISLSSWLRDYLYISLGGNRKGRFRTYVNLFITMFLGGLWHGAAMRFILWGALHGAALAVHKFMMERFPNSMKKSGSEMSLGRRIVSTLLTFNFVCFSWIFFRADSMQTAGEVLNQIFNNFHIEIMPQFITGYLWVILLMIIGYVLHFVSRRWEDVAAQVVVNSHFVIKVAALVAIIWLVLQTRSSVVQPFIYFQF